MNPVPQGHPPPRRRNIIFQQFVGLATSRLGSSLLNALSTLVLLRAVDANSYARFASAMVLALFLGSFANLGLEVLAMEAQAVKDDELTVRASGVHLALQLAAMIFTPLVAFVTGAYWVTAALLVAFSIGERRMSFWNCCLVGMGRSGETVGSNFISRLPPFVVLGLPATTTPNTTTAVFAALSLSGVALGSWRSRRRVGRLESRLTLFDLGVIRRSRAYWTSSLGQQLRQLDLPLMSGVASANATSAFAPASRLVGPMNLLPHSLGMAVFPRAAAGHHADVQRGLALGVASVIPIWLTSLVLWAWGRPLFVTLIGTEYASTWPIICLMLAAIGLSVPGVVSLASLQGYGLRRFAAVFEWTSSLAYLTAIAVIAPLYGGLGAAWTLMAVSAATAVIPTLRLAAYWREAHVAP